MTEIDWERLVVVTAKHGEKFVGTLPEQEDDPKKYIEDRTYEHGPIELSNVRVLAVQTRAIADSRGQPVGIQRAPLLLPMDVLNSPAQSVHIVPSTWYFPVENREAKDNLAGLIHQAEEMEARASAEAAGIITPSSTTIRAPH
jgi:hypothetical protein